MDSRSLEGANKANVQGGFRGEGTHGTPCGLRLRVSAMLQRGKVQLIPVPSGPARGRGTGPIAIERPSRSSDAVERFVRKGGGLGRACHDPKHNYRGNDFMHKAGLLPLSRQILYYSTGLWLTRPVQRNAANHYKITNYYGT